MASREELIRRVAGRLGCVGDDGSYQPEDRQRIDTNLDGIVGSLARRGIWPPGVLSTYPDEAIDPLSAVIGSRLADDFGLQGDEVTILASRAQAAQDELRALTRRRVAAPPLRVDYF